MRVFRIIFPNFAFLGGPVRQDIIPFATKPCWNGFSICLNSSPRLQFARPMGFPFLSMTALFACVGSLCAVSMCIPLVHTHTHTISYSFAQFFFLSLLHFAAAVVVVVAVDQCTFNNCEEVKKKTPELCVYRITCPNQRITAYTWHSILSIFFFSVFFSFRCIIFPSVSFKLCTVKLFYLLCIHTIYLCAPGCVCVCVLKITHRLITNRTYLTYGHSHPSLFYRYAQAHTFFFIHIGLSNIFFFSFFIFKVASIIDVSAYIVVYLFIQPFYK